MRTQLRNIYKNLTKNGIKEKLVYLLIILISNLITYQFFSNPLDENKLEPLIIKNTNENSIVLRLPIKLLVPEIKGEMIGIYSMEGEKIIPKAKILEIENQKNEDFKMITLEIEKNIQIQSTKLNAQTYIGQIPFKYFDIAYKGAKDSYEINF